MKAIVAVDKNNGIGKNGHLLFHIEDDLQQFKLLTEWHAVIMGRKTLESLPGGKPLKNRINIILTRNKDYKVNGGIVIHSVDEIETEVLKNILTDDIFVIGGSSIYEQLMKYCNRIFMTKINTDGNADVFFPELDNSWNLLSKNPPVRIDEKTGLEYQFFCYYR